MNYTSKIFELDLRDFFYLHTKSRLVITLALQHNELLTENETIVYSILERVKREVLSFSRSSSKTNRGVVLTYNVIQNWEMQGNGVS